MHTVPRIQEIKRFLLIKCFFKAVSNSIVLLLIVIFNFSVAQTKFGTTNDVGSSRIREHERNDADEYGDEEEPKEDIEARERYRYQQRAGEDGTIPSNALWNAKQQIDQMRVRARTKGRTPMDGGIANWEWLGPGNIGGRIRAILIHPTNPNIMWIGSVSGGIWRTDNAGQSWYPMDDFMASLAVTSIVLDPTNTNIMYASTGEGFGNIDALQGAGIFKSFDGGYTWYQLPSTDKSDFQYTNRLAHDPSTANTLLAATSTGVFRSTNGGESWVHVGIFSNALQVQFHPLDHNQALCGTASKFYLSINGGEDWLEQTSGSPNALPSVPGRCEGSFAPSNSNYIYVSMNRNNGEIWGTQNGGQTWTRRNTGTNYMLGAINQGWYDNAIWVSPVDPNTIAVGGVKLYSSTDGGQTLIYAAGLHADYHVIVSTPDFDPNFNRTTVFVGNDGGIQRTWDITTATTTDAWVNLNNNLGITQFYSGAAAPNGSVIVGGSQDNDKLRYRPVDGPNAWYQSTSGDGGFSAIDYNNPNNVYGEYIYLDIKKSTDGGNHYFNSIVGLGDAQHSNLAAFIAPFSLDPNDPKILIGGGKRIWRTINNAGNWCMIRDSFFTNRAKCSAIDIAKGSSGIVWVGYEGGTVSRTSNANQTNCELVLWVNVDENGSTPLPDRNITDIAINPTNSNEVIVTVGGYQNNSVWLTTDNGNTWLQRTGTGIDSLPAIQVNTVRYHPVNTNWVYIGTDLGVFASEDKGLTWNVTPLYPSDGTYPSNEGPVNVEVDELFWQGDEYLIAATHGRGMFRCRPLPLVYVDWSNPLPFTEGDGSFFNPYKKLVAGITASGNGTTLAIKAGTYLEAPLSFTKRCNVIKTGLGDIVITAPVSNKKQQENIK